MTTTISRLYNNYTDAQRAVSELEAAGVPHSDISIVANNSDGWFSKTRRSTVTVTASMIAQKLPALVLASVRASVVRRVCWPGLGCWPFLVSVLSLRQAGLRRRRWVLPPVQRPAVSSAR